MREGSGACPRCAAPLRDGLYEGSVPVATCPTCHGALLLRRDLATLVARLSAGVGRELSPDFTLPDHRDPGPLAACPACGGPSEHYGFMGSNEAKIDQCLRCERVWLDPAELSRVVYLVARTERRRDDRERAMAAARPGPVVTGEAWSDLVDDLLLSELVDLD